MALNNYNAVLILTIMSFWHSAYYGLVVSKEDNYNDVVILTIRPFDAMLTTAYWHQKETITIMQRD